jgi:hypothetical protein
VYFIEFPRKGQKGFLNNKVRFQNNKHIQIVNSYFKNTLNSYSFVKKTELDLIIFLKSFLHEDLFLQRKGLELKVCEKV